MKERGFSARNEFFATTPIVVSIIAVFCVGLYVAGYSKGSSFSNKSECKSLGSNKFAAALAISVLPNIVDNLVDGQAIPIYKQGLAAGVKSAIISCTTNR